MTTKKINKVTHSDQQPTDVSGVSQETENKKGNLKNALATPDIVDTMEFYMYNTGFAEVLKKALRKMDCTHLKGVKIIDSEFQVKKDNKQALFIGIDFALEKLIANPDAPIILTSFLDIHSEYLKNKRDEINLLLAKPNVKFIRMPFIPQDLLNLFGEQKEIEEPKESKEDILKTITFKVGIDTGKIIENNMIKLLKKIDLTGLKNTMFIYLIHRENEQQHAQDYYGLQVAFDQLQKNPEQKIIIITPLSGDDLKNLIKISRNGAKSDMLTLVSSGKNVRFFEYAIDLKLLEHTFDTPEESNEDILNTLQFYDVQGRYPYLKEFFATLDLHALKLKNSIVVDLRADDKEKGGWVDMSGLRIANETLKKDPDAKIILCSLIPVDMFKKIITGTKSDEYLTALLQGKNVRIIQSSGGNSMTKEEVLAQFDGLYKEAETGTGTASEVFKQVSETEAETAFQNVMVGKISHFMHDAGHWTGDKEEIYNMSYTDRLTHFFQRPQEKKTEQWINFENEMIYFLQFQHPSFKKLPRENNLQWIVDMYTYEMTKPLPEGSRFEGYFFDRDGTLYDNKKLQFNQSIIDMIKQYEQEGKKVIIRTGGNVEMKQKLLDEIGLKYTIQNKSEYKGGTVECAIDNDPPEKIWANAQIKVEKHIKV